MVLNAEDKVEVRPVKAGAAWKDRWIISEGLKVGDRVVTEGLQKAPPGTKVRPVSAQ